MTVVVAPPPPAMTALTRRQQQSSLQCHLFPCWVLEGEAMDSYSYDHSYDHEYDSVVVVMQDQLCRLQ